MRHTIPIIYILLVLCLVCHAEPKVACNVETRDVSVGEAFTYQIVVSDAKDVDDIVLKTDDFQVRAMAPSKNNSTQVSIVNGRMTKIEKHETLFNFQLVPKRKGTLVIPSVKVVADGKEFRTRAININSGDGEQVTDIILELSFNESECYVGQTLMAKWTLFFGRQLNIGEFDLPLFSDGAFSFPAYEEKIDQSQANLYRRLPVSGVDGVIGKLGAAMHGGENMRCLSFSRPVTAMKAGDFRLEAGTVMCEIPNKRARARRSASPFDDSFFDGFFDRTPMRSVLIKGNAVNLQVKELPQEGLPDDFTGILGRCSLAVAANPVDVNVGDPIVMTLSVSGLAYPDSVRIPKIASMAALNGKFRVSDEDSGIVRDGAKVFQCTLRALNGKVTEIPALKVPFFNSASGKYEYAESAAVPLAVHEVATVTAADIEGKAAAEDAPVGAEVESMDAGIAHNYSYDKLLQRESPGFFNWTATSWKSIACVGSVLLYAIIALIVAAVRHANANPAKAAARQAVSDAVKCINTASDGESDRIFQALQTIIAAKLKLQPGALSFSDVAPGLRKAGMADDGMRSLERLFSDLEAANYAGGAARQGLAEDARGMVGKIQQL
ncbi:MAG: BatD family protein [Victivallales bacterium]|nr:BatD family protein [Victivallales bacterium]